jgi:hypothetical protein
VDCPFFHRIAAGWFRTLQETSPSKDSLYSIALVAGVAEMQKQRGYIDDGDHGSRIRTDHHRLIVRKNPEIKDDLPSQSDEFHFEYLDDASLLGRYNKLKKGFSIPRSPSDS